MAIGVGDFTIVFSVEDTVVLVEAPSSGTKEGATEGVCSVEDTVVLVVETPSSDITEGIAGCGTPGVETLSSTERPAD